MLNAQVMTEHGGWPVIVARGRGLPSLTLSDFGEVAWQFSDARSMLAAWRATVDRMPTNEGETWLRQQSATIAGTG